jgi:sec-independent protein translocase protein TatC
MFGPQRLPAMISPRRANGGDVVSEKPPPSPDGRMTLIEHLTELRSRIIKCLFAVAIGAVVAWFLYPHIIDILLHPYREVVGDRSITGGRLLQTDPLEGFAVRIKIATYGGITFAMPVLLYQLWRFITPALYPNEKRYVIPFVTAALILFAMGAALAYWTLPKALRWLIGIGGGDLITGFSPAKYFQLVFYMMLAFGICFEFPVLLVFLQLAGVLHNSTLRKWRRHAIVGITIIVAVATPSNDPISLIVLSAPLVVFYEAAIWIGWLQARRRTRRSPSDVS